MQLIDATQWFKPLRKNLGKKNCELSDDDIQRICDTFLAFEETEQSKIFPNAAFGYWKVTVERPLRLKGIDPSRAYTPKEIKALKETAERDEDAPPVIRKIHKPGTSSPTRCTACSRRPSTASAASSSTSPTATCATPSRCRCWKRAASRRSCAARCCPTPPDAWYDPDSVKIGYEISFTRYFYKPQPLRTLEEIRADILALERETEGLLAEIIGARAVRGDPGQGQDDPGAAQGRPSTRFDYCQREYKWGEKQIRELIDDLVGERGVPRRQLAERIWNPDDLLGDTEASNRRPEAVSRIQALGRPMARRCARSPGTCSGLAMPSARSMERLKPGPRRTCR